MRFLVLKVIQIGINMFLITKNKFKKSVFQFINIRINNLFSRENWQIFMLSELEIILLASKYSTVCYVVTQVL